jgi:hypothetical protein
LHPRECSVRQPVVVLGDLENGHPGLGIDQVFGKYARFIGSKLQCAGLFRRVGMVSAWVRDRSQNSTDHNEDASGMMKKEAIALRNNRRGG